MDINTRFGKYEIIKLLGSGATSDVYLARDTVLERQVALKILKPALVSDEEGFLRFTREAQTAGKLFHDHIATVFDMGEVEGRYFIAMQYIDGVSMEKYIHKNGPMPWGDILRLATQIGKALSYAHKQGFLHRDIKPNNIMVSSNGNFILTDFGLTRALMHSGMLSSSSAILGTPPYIPPEIWNAQTATEKSDQYSLACVIDEAITGSARFAAETPQAIITKHLIEQPNFNNYTANIDQNIKFIIQKALSKSSKDRFDSIDAFVSSLNSPKDFDVHGFLSKIEEKQRSQSQKQALEKLKKKRRRKGWTIASLIILVVSAVSCGVLYLVFQDNIQAFLNAGKEEQGLETVAPISAAVVQEEFDQSTPTGEMMVETEPPKSSPTGKDEISISNTQTSSPTPTATATLDPTPTMTPTQLAVIGSKEEVPLGSGVEIELINNGNTGIEVYLLRGDGSAIESKTVYIYNQKQDLSGNWITDGRIDYRKTDNAGSVNFYVDPGDYIISADFYGYNWGSAHDVEGQANVHVENGKTTRLVLRLARLQVGLIYASGNMVEDKTVYLYTQQKNTSDQWVTKDRVNYLKTDNSGEVIFDVTPGNYIVAVDFAGYNWGDAVDVEGEANIPLKSGEIYQLIKSLGAIVVELIDGSGNPIEGGTVYIYYQNEDVNNNPTIGSRIDYRKTDNTGRVGFSLTPGVYAFTYGDRTYYNIEVLEGLTTITDGDNVTYED